MTKNTFILYMCLLAYLVKIIKILCNDSFLSNYFNSHKGPALIKLDYKLVPRIRAAL